MADQDGEVRDVGEIDVFDGKPVGVFDQNAVVAEAARKCFIGRRERHGLFERSAIAVDREIREVDLAAAVATEDGAAVKVCAGAKRGMIAARNRKVMRAIREPDFRGNFGNARRQMDRAGSGKWQCDQQCEDQALFYLHARSMAIEFRGVRFPPLCDLTVSAPSGAVIGVIGEKGAGKGALLRLACGNRPA